MSLETFFSTGSECLLNAQRWMPRQLEYTLPMVCPPQSSPDQVKQLVTALVDSGAYPSGGGAWSPSAGNASLQPLLNAFHCQGLL
eukprot:13186637-Alexandrium_andersonii.AAC.1